MVETPVLELATDYQRTLERIAAAGVQLIRERGADCLVLGCMIMAFLDATAELEDRVGVPVVNPAKAALRWPKRWSAAVSDTASWPTLCRPGWRPAS